jgi:hypothetical protein
MFDRLCPADIAALIKVSGDSQGDD